jgi:chaperonin cofactor prefoldin
MPNQTQHELLSNEAIRARVQALYQAMREIDERLQEVTSLLGATMQAAEYLRGGLR